MEFDGVQWTRVWSKGMRPFPVVQIKPSHEDGIFVGYFGNEARVGKIATLFGVNGEDAVALENGDISVLDRYLRESSTKPGVFTVAIKGSHVYLEHGHGSSSGVTDNVLREYAPPVTDQAS